MKKHIGILAVISILLWGQPTFGLTLVTPKKGESFHAGDTITLLAKLSPGEEITTVAFHSSKLLFETVNGPPFQFDYKIPPEFVGELRVWAIGKNDHNPSAPFIDAPKITVNVILPPTVTLQAIGMDTQIMFLLFESEEPNTERLFVAGRYSDGISRDLTSSASGTTYESTDEKVATVDKEGIVTGISIGKAFIVAKNGDKEARRQVIVFSEKQ